MYSPSHLWPAGQYTALDCELTNKSPWPTGTSSTFSPETVAPQVSILVLDNKYSLSDRLKLEGSNVINMDIPATNGVIQVVESIVEMEAGVGS